MRVTNDLRCKDDIYAKPLPIRFYVLLAFVTSPIWIPLVLLCLN